MTKKTAAPAPAPAEQAVQPNPNVVVITDASHVAFQAACHLIRTGGYIFDPNNSPEVFAAMGTSTVTLIRANPDERSVAVAEAAIDYAGAREQAQWDREVKEAAQRLVDDAKRATKQAELEALIESQTKELRRAKDALKAI